MTNEKHFLKTISQWAFDYGLFTNLLLETFLRVHSNSKEVPYLYWQSRYPNFKTTCHIKLKFFLWNKLLEGLLPPKYLMSVAVTVKFVCYFLYLTIRKPSQNYVKYYLYQTLFGFLWNSNFRNFPACATLQDLERKLNME